MVNVSFDVSENVSTDVTSIGEAPASLPGGFLWLRADATIGGSGVSDWPNLYPAFAETVYAQQTNPTQQPTLTGLNPDFNDKPTVRFAALQAQFMNLVGVPDQLNGNNVPFTAFMALKPNAGGSAMFWSMGESTDSSKSLWCGQGSGNHQFRRRWVTNNHYNGGPVAQTLQTFVWAFNGTNITLLINGEPEPTINNVPAATDPTAFNRAIINARAQGAVTDRYNTYDLAEFIITNQANTTEEIESIESYFNERYVA